LHQRFPFTIDLDVDESWRDDGSLAVDDLISPPPSPKKVMLWIDDGGIFNPKVILYQGMIPKEAAVGKLCYSGRHVRDGERMRKGRDPGRFGLVLVRSSPVRLKTGLKSEKDISCNPKEMMQRP